MAEAPSDLEKQKTENEKKRQTDLEKVRSERDWEEYYRICAHEKMIKASFGSTPRDAETNYDIDKKTIEREWLKISKPRYYDRYRRG